MDRIPDFSIEITPDFLQGLNSKTNQHLLISKMLLFARNVSMEKKVEDSDSTDDTGDNLEDKYYLGCIREITYSNDSKKITHMVIQLGRETEQPVQFEGGRLGPVKNAGDFKEVFEEAACCGHMVSFNIKQKGGERSLETLKIFPKQCNC